MTLTGFLILVVIVVVAVMIFLELAALPGKKALERGHPQAEAINVLGWLGLLFGGVPWLVALVWAFTRPGSLTGDLAAETAGGSQKPAPASGEG